MTRFILKEIFLTKKIVIYICVYKRLSVEVFEIVLKIYLEMRLYF